MAMANYLKSSLAALLLLGCYTPKKAEKHLNKAAKYPEKVADICGKMFPNKVTHDTLVTTEYDFIEVMCDDRIIYIDSITKKTDTVIKYVVKKVPVPGKTITITNTVKDSADIYKLAVEIQAWVEKAKKSEAKASRSGDLMKLLGLLAFILLGLLIKKNGKSNRPA